MKKSKKLFAALLMLVMVISLLYPASAPVTVKAATAKLNKKTAVMIKGQTITLKLNKAKGRIVWKSSNKKVASVSQKGKVTAKKKGTATITAKNKKKTYKCKITVQTPSLNYKSATMTVGQTLTLKFKGTNKKATWKSSNKNVATISGNGRVKAINSGYTTINANLLGITFTCRITVIGGSSQQPSTSKGTRANPINLSGGYAFTYSDYRGQYTVSLRLLETIDGEQANQIVQEENMFNEKPASNNRWVLYHYNLNYTSGNGEVSASDIINQYYFYNANSTRAIGESCESAVFSGQRDGLGVHDVRLYPGGSSDVWLGLLIDNAITGTTFKKTWYDSNYNSHEIWFANK